ncbi:MAG TPA: type II secretion system secretin GspD [Ramlibacter sp.]|nr:type II secretion system secretin GspD [Ramlibacter sp.]
MTHPLASRSIALALVCALVAPAGHAQQQQQQRARGSREPVTLNFVNADIEAVARTMAAITGRNIVVDPRVKGTLNLSTDRPVSPQAAYNQFLAALRLSGFTMVDSGGILKLVPEADAKLQGGAVHAGPAPQGGGQIVTQIFRLNYEPAGNLVPILRPLITPNNTINVDPATNSLVITDYADNLQRIGRIIATLDVSNATDVDVIPLQHTVAADVAPIVQRLLDASGGTGGVGAPGQPGIAVPGDTSARTTILAETRSNALLVRAANPARLALVRSLVQKLDQPGGSTSTGNIWVVYLKNADATRLAVTLRAAMAALTPTGAASVGGSSSSGAAVPVTAANSSSATGGSSAATAPTTPAAQVQTGGQIQADPATNALIITAPEPQYRQMRAVIDRLDTRRAQVYIEGLIAQVNDDKAAQFGIQWQTPLNSTNSGTVGVLGTNFNTGGPNIIGLAAQGATSGTAATAPTLPGAGINFGTVSKIAGHFVLTSIVNFLQTNDAGNVLSTPNLLTLDNEEAKIVVGQNVPFVTGQFTNTGSTNGSVSPFQTIERKDVGLTLRVRPQVSENGSIKMQIFQEVSSVVQSSINSPQGITTNKSSIESSVIVQDGQIVVLGGLLSDTYAENEQKVPVLGDVPVVGDLFKSRTRSRQKQNLMVFLRPVVLRDPTATELLSLDRYELMRGQQIESQPPRSIVTPINGAVVMPPLVAPVPAPVPAPAPADGSAPAAPGVRAVPAPLGR